MIGINGYQSTTTTQDKWGDLSTVGLKFNNITSGFAFNGKVFDVARLTDSRGVQRLGITQPDFSTSFTKNPYSGAEESAGINLPGAESPTRAHIVFSPGFMNPAFIPESPFHVTDPASNEGKDTYTLDFKGVPASANPALAFNLNFDKNGTLMASADFGPGTQWFIDSRQALAVPLEGATYFTSFNKDGVMGVLERTPSGFSPGKSDNHIYQEWQAR